MLNIKSVLSSSDKRRLFENFISLFVLQGANYILPLITFPYLVRVLGAEKFGLIAFAQAFVQYFIVLTDYGFNLSATKEVSVNRDNKEKLSEIFFSVMFIKLALLFLSFFIMSVIVFSFDKFRKDWLVYYLTFGIVIGQTLFPVWFFQGMEKMKYITALNITSKILFTIFIFVFIHSVSDYIYVPLIYSLGFITGGLLGIFFVFRNFNIKFALPGTRQLLKYLKDSSHFFLSRVSVSVYTSTNAFILGIFTDNKMVGYYSIAEKLYTSLQQLFHPLLNALYPYVAYEKKVSTYKKIFKLAVLVNIILVVFLFIFSPEIISLIFGNGLEVSVDVFRILLICGVVVVPSILIGYPFLAALGFTGYANYSVVFGSIFHVIGLFLLILLGLVNVYSVALMVFFTESFVLGYRIYGILKNGLWREN